MSMNFLYITLFFNIVAGIVQTFIKPWNKLLCPRVIEVCCLPFEPRHDFLHLIIVVETFSQQDVSLGEEISGNRWARGRDCTEDGPIYGRSPFALRNLMTECASHLAGLWIGVAISNTSYSNKADSTNEHGSQVKDQGRRQCCHNKHKNFPFGLHVMYLYFPDTPRTDFKFGFLSG